MPGQPEPQESSAPAPDDPPTPVAGRAATGGGSEAATKKPATKRAAPSKKAATKKPSATKPSATKRAATKPGAAGEPASTVTAGKPSAGSEPTDPAAPEHDVPAPCAPWSDAELSEFRTALTADIERLREELNMGEADLAEMLDHSDGAGDDQADAGAQTLEREQEMSVAANARELLDQSGHALRRLDSGTYGICESCGAVIPAARLRAFPRATLCIACKQAEERG